MDAIERDDIVAIMSSSFRQTGSWIGSSPLWRKTVKKKKKLTAEFWRRDAEVRRQLEERTAYHTAKLAEERAAQKSS